MHTSHQLPIHYTCIQSVSYPWAFAWERIPWDVTAFQTNIISQSLLLSRIRVTNWCKVNKLWQTGRSEQADQLLNWQLHSPEIAKAFCFFFTSQTGQYSIQAGEYNILTEIVWRCCLLYRLNARPTNKALSQTRACVTTKYIQKRSMSGRKSSLIIHQKAQWVWYRSVWVCLWGKEAYCRYISILD